MSERLPPLAVPLEPVDTDTVPDDEEHDEERPRLTRQMVESLEGPASNRAETAWANEVAEQVAALWEHRPGATPFAQAVISARQEPPKRR